jgi:hypothetical protein
MKSDNNRSSRFGGNLLQHWSGSTSTRLFLLASTAVALCCSRHASAMERFFTYTYEPETMPAGVFEYEQWITSRLLRNSTVGQDNYNRWEFRHEFEYGVSDNYTLSFYINESLTNFREPGTHQHVSELAWDGISLENRYMVLNPADHAVGLALYLEPRVSDTGAEIEERIILGQRHGDWKWALNLTHATEWADRFRKREGEVELSFGLTRHLGNDWSVGIEARDHNELPEYEKWENTALYLGPVVTYRRERWWATLTVMPQIFGANFADNADGDHHFELEGHERLNIRLMAGISF